jgi:hypothetical protein
VWKNNLKVYKNSRLFTWRLRDEALPLSHHFRAMEFRTAMENSDREFHALRGSPKFPDTLVSPLDLDGRTGGCLFLFDRQLPGHQGMQRGGPMVSGAKIDDAGNFYKNLC